MNKEIIDCIKAEKDREIVKRKEKEAKIQTIKDFFMDLPEGEYNVRLVHNIKIKVLKNNPRLNLLKKWWYEDEYYEEEDKEEYKEKWMADLHCHTIEIYRIPKDLYIIRKSAYDDYMSSGRSREMDNWSDDEVQVFSEHLDWFEKEIGRQYCKKP